MITLPFLGRITIMRDTITMRRWTFETLEGPTPERPEAVVCLGTIRVYLTPWRSLSGRA